MDLGEASKIVRAVHGQYNSEKGAFAYLDEVLSAITSNQETIDKIEQRKQEAADACDLMQAKLDGLTALYANKIQDAEAQFQNQHAVLFQEIQTLQAKRTQQQQSEGVYREQLAKDERESQARVLTLQHELSDLQHQKQDLIAQVAGLQDSVRAIRSAMAGVPA
jgi:chromosome segregation ATPase